MAQARFKVRSYHVKLHGHDNVFTVLATSTRGAYMAAVASLNVPSNRKPVSEFITLAAVPIGTTL